MQVQPGPGDEELLPDRTADDREELWELDDASRDDDRLRREVPPHHGD